MSLAEEVFCPRSRPGGGLARTSLPTACFRWCRLEPAPLEFRHQVEPDYAIAGIKPLAAITWFTSKYAPACSNWVRPRWLLSALETNSRWICTPPRNGGVG